MKNNTRSILILLFTISLIFTSCSTPATSEAQGSQVTQAPLPEYTPTEISLPTPTATPEPIPCNIAFDSDRDANREIYVMDPDGNNLLNLTNNPADDWAPAWSPDGSQIAFVSFRDGQSGKIYVMNADGSEVRQLTFESGSDWPDWSPDGSKITYTDQNDIFVINADGSGQSVNLTNSPKRDIWPSWSPDGSQIVWSSGADGNWNNFVMNADGSNVLQITDNGQVNTAEWTVDGKIFTGWGWTNQEQFCNNCVVNADGTNIVDAGGKGELQRYLPFWTLDGNRVELVQVALNGGDEEIYLVGEIFPDVFYNLTNNPASDRNPDWPANCGPGTEVATTDNKQPNDPNEIVIGYAGDDQWQPQRKTDFQKACGELDIQCIYGEIPELIAQGVDAIVQNSNNISVAGLHQDILNARDNGIPVFILDAEAITDGAYSVTIDQHVWAKTSLEWLFEKIGGKGQVAYFDLAPFNRYADTIDDLLSRYPEISVVEKRDGKYDPVKVKPETVLFSQTYPELKAVWTSVNMTEAIRELDESGIPQAQWPVINCEATMDGLNTWMRIRKANPAFDCIALANPPGIAYDAVYAAYYLVTGAQIDESVLDGQYGHSLYVDIPIITSDNLQEWLQKTQNEGNVNYVDELMEPETIRERWFLD